MHLDLMLLEGISQSVARQYVPRRSEERERLQAYIWSRLWERGVPAEQQALPHDDKVRLAFGYARILALRWLRKQSRERQRDARIQEQTRLHFADRIRHVAGPDRQTEHAEAVEKLREARRRLQATERASLHLRFDRGLSYRAIGAATGVSHQTARMHVTAALAALRIAFDGTDEFRQPRIAV